MAGADPGRRVQIDVSLTERLEGGANCLAWRPICLARDAESEINDMPDTTRTGAVTGSSAHRRPGSRVERLSVGRCRGSPRKEMLMSAVDKAKDKAQAAKGKLKKDTGKALDDPVLEGEGKADQVKGNVKQAGEKVKDAVKK